MPYKSAEKRKEHYWNNREKFLEKQRKYHALKKDEVNKNRRERYKTDPEYAAKIKSDKKSCKYTQKKKVHDATYYVKHKEKIKKMYEKVSYRFSCAKSRAKKRNLEFDLTLEIYTSLITKPCYYCGKDLGKHGIALDRIDSGKGYVVSNVVPCCSICNVIKMDLDYNKFLEHISLIYERNQKGLLNVQFS